MESPLLVFLCAAIAAIWLFIWKRKSRVEHTDHLVLMSDEGPVINMSVCTDASANTEPLVMSTALASQLRMMVAPSASMLTSLQQAGTAIKVVFKPDVTEGLANGTLTLLQGDQGSYLTAVATKTNGIRTKGQIAGNGQVVANNAARAAAVAAAAFQVASIITAQKFLADIDQKLGEIGKTVSEIQRWNESELFNDLISSYQYLHNISESVCGGALREIDRAAYLNQIEEIDRLMAKLSGMCYDRISQLALEHPANRWTIGGVRTDRTRLEHADGMRARFVREGLAAQQVRLLAAQLRGALPTDRNVATKRIQAVSTDISRLLNASDKIAGQLTESASKLKYSRLPGFFHGDDGDERKNFLSKIESTNAALHAESFDIASVGEHLLKLNSLTDQARGKPMAIRVTLDRDGSVASAARYLST